MALQQKKIDLLTEEKERLSEKNCKNEIEIASLKIECNKASKSMEETVLSKKKLIEEKEHENSELRTQVDDLRKKVEDKDTATKISQNENFELKSKITNLCEKVKVTEEELAFNKTMNLEMTSKLEKFSEKVKVAEQLVKERYRCKPVMRAPNQSLQKQLMEVHQKWLQEKEKTTPKRIPKILQSDIVKELEDGEFKEIPMNDEASTSRQAVEEFPKRPSSPVELNFPESSVYGSFKCFHCGKRFTNATALHNHNRRKGVNCKNYESYENVNKNYESYENVNEKYESYENVNTMTESEQDVISMFDIDLF